MLRDRLNFDWITELLAVGGSVPAGAYERLAQDHGVRAVVDMRSEASDDAAALSRAGIEFLNLPTDDHYGVSVERLDAGVAFAGRWLDRGNKVLVHCEHGIGRAPSLGMSILVARGLAPLEALALAKDRRPLVSPSPHQYEAWAAWLRRRKTLTGASWDVPDFDAFKSIAYRHLMTT